MRTEKELPHTSAGTSLILAGDRHNILAALGRTETVEAVTSFRSATRVNSDEDSQGDAVCSRRTGMLGSGMPILNAIGSSQLSVGAFGLTTAVNYAISGLIDWPIAPLFIAGGLLGMRAALHLAKNQRILSSIFTGAIFTVAIYMLIRTGVALWRPTK